MRFLPSLRALAPLTLLASQLLLATPAPAADSSAEIRAVIQTFNDQMMVDPTKTMTLIGYPFLMDEKVYLFPYEVERDLGRPIPLENFMTEPKLLKVEVFQATQAPAADAATLEPLRVFIRRLHWQDSAWLAKATIRYPEIGGKSRDVQNYFLLRRGPSGWRIYGGAQIAEMQEKGG